VLGARFLVGRPRSKAAFESMRASLGEPKVQLTPAGRRLDMTAASPVEAAALLAAALLPLPAGYPLPFMEGVA
jgi:hypothetical protein